MTGFGWDLPPGVTESMIPGNRPEDMAAERYADGLTDDDVLEYAYNEELDCAGGVIHELAPRTWAFEPPRDERWLPTIPWERFVAFRRRPRWARGPLRTRRLRRLWPAERGIRLLFPSEDDAVAYMLTFHGDDLIEAMIERHVEELVDRVAGGDY